MFLFPFPDHSALPFLNLPLSWGKRGKIRIQFVVFRCSQDTQKGSRDRQSIYGSGAQKRECKLQIKTGENFHTEMVMEAKGMAREGSQKRA